MRRKNRQSDEELLDAVRRGDTSAYGMLYQRHVLPARALARRLVRGDEEVEDVLVETFAGVLEIIRRGGGPGSAFRPFLLASLRRYAAAGEVDLTDPDACYVDPELAGLEQAPLARAYRSLPERWRAVLWHIEVEGATPAETAPLLGMSARRTARFAREARGALREAYLAFHESDAHDEACRPVLALLLRHVEGLLPKREARTVDQHIAGCIECRSVFLELTDVTQGLRMIVGPLYAGPAAEDYLSDLRRVRQEARRGPVRGVLLPLARLLPGLWRRLPPAQRAAAAGAALLLSAVTVILSAEPVGERRAVGGLALPTLPSPDSAVTEQAGDGPGRPERGERARPRDGHRAGGPGGAPDGLPAGEAGSGPRRGTGAPAGSRASDASARPQPGAGGLPVRRPLAARDPGPAPSAAGVPDPAPAGADHPVRLTRRPDLGITVQPLGALVRGRSGIVALGARNTGTARTERVVATVLLPPGVRFRGLVALERPGAGRPWSCRDAARAVRCTRPGLAAGASATAFLRVKVAEGAPLGRPVRAWARSGERIAFATSSSGVRATGVPARFAAEGRLLTQVIGGVLFGPPGDAPTGVPATVPGGPEANAESGARLTLPARGRVLWAGLYWSAAGHGRLQAGEVLVRAPGARGPVTVRPASVIRRDLPGLSGYQAFAEVTGLVRAHASGQWAVAGASAALRPGGPGVLRWARWTLVVVAADPRQPFGRVMVLDTAEVVDDRGRLNVPLTGLAPAASPVRIDLAVWTGERDGSAALRDRSRRGASARGDGQGSDVSLATARPLRGLLGQRPVLTLTGVRDTLLFGVAAVSAHHWS